MRPADLVAEEEWKRQLVLTPTHKPTGCVANAIAYLENSPGWSGVLAYDEFAATIKIMLPPPWYRPNGGWDPQIWEDQHDTLTARWLQLQGVPAAVRTAEQAVVAVA